MKYVIQIMKDTKYTKWFWGNNDKIMNTGPYEFVNHPNVIKFSTREEAEAYAGEWMTDGDVRVTREDNPSLKFHPALETVTASEIIQEGYRRIGKPTLKPLRDYTSAERKEMPVQTIMAEYFPDAFAALARHSKKANDKHNPGQQLHWARDKSKDHLNCAGRHLLTPDRPDADTGEIEAVCLMWRAAAYVQLKEEARLIALGIRPLSGVTTAG
jgi:hypothetical protein